MFAWYKELSTGERRTFWSCFGGWALDAMDVQLFSFLVPALALALNIGTDQSSVIGTSALISSSVGGWIAGSLADRYGRVRVLQGAIIWYSVFTGLSGFAQSYDQLLILRTLQGLGFGGEWAAGAVLMGEIIRPQHRGKAVGCVQSAFAVGWFAAAAVSTAVLATLPPDIAWRTVFFIGLLPALLVIYIRRNVTEPPLFARTLEAEAASGNRPTPFEIFAPNMIRRTLLAAMLALGVQGSSYAIIFWLPTYLRTVRHLSVTGAGSYVMVSTAGAFCGYLVSAYLTDAVGRRRNFMIYAVGCWCIDFAYMLLPFGNGAILFLGFFLGFFSQGIYASLGPYFTELFPTRIRATGQSFAYNVGRSIGSFFVVIVTVLTARFGLGLGQAIGTLALGGYSLALIAIFFLPETQGIALEDAGPTGTRQHATHPKPGTTA